MKFIFRATVLSLLLAAGGFAVGYFYPEKILCVDSGRNVSADAIIVLGGGQHERPVRAAELYKAHAAPRIIITGAGDDSINRQILLRNGVPPQAIETEGKSATTRENALFTLKLLRAENVRSAILVTSWYHSRRALATFEHYGPDVQFYSSPAYFGFDYEDWKRTGVGSRMRMEFVKLPAYSVRYGINPF